ncbi:MAG TPA: putative Fe-S cluster assembly protein SufT [Verrucomicrobiales bacterium]|nr:putative Fe-S cluster assembly protein SufT [Verrucomicrobiales bacterium]
MNSSELIPLNRECHAIRIPSGDSVVLQEGFKVRITQSLGETYTVVCETGELVRIQGVDADALGLKGWRDKVDSGEEAVFEGDVDKDLIWDQMKNCYDPEIPVNVVDLGLIYDCDVEALEKKGENKVNIKMTLTAAGCGMGPVIAGDVEARVRTVPGVTDVNVELVWDPPWGQAMMSEAAKLQLGLL